MPETALQPAGAARKPVASGYALTSAEYAKLHRSRFTEAAELLDAIDLFSPMNLAALVRRFEDIINAIDTRLGELEYRLDHAGIKALEDGVPDDETARYFTLPMLRRG